MECQSRQAAMRVEEWRDWYGFGSREEQEVSRVRELLAVLGVERHGVRVKDPATVLKKHRVTKWVMGGVCRMGEDAGAAGTLDEHDGCSAAIETGNTWTDAPHTHMRVWICQLA